MSTSKTKKRDSQKENTVPGKATETQSQDFVRREMATQRNTHDNTAHTKKDICAPTVKCERNTPTANAAEEQEWHSVRHPRLPTITPPRYFVNKSGVISSSAKGKLKPLKKMKGRIACYMLYIDKGKQLAFKLEEIMVYTFSDVQFDSDKHYIFHKDGDQNNCAWDNLVVCDTLTALQHLEIAWLEKQHPGTKYTVVRNVRNTFTFERYLVSDAGEVYSLIRHQHLRSAKCVLGYQFVMLYSDADTKQATSKHVNLYVHSVVIQSFKGRRMKNLHIDHINGEKLDNSLKNLAFVTPSENCLRAYGPIQTAARNVRKEQGNAPKKVTPRPLPPVTGETKWKSVGTLPWNGRSFSQYEVSNIGHVRKIGQSKLLTLGCTLIEYTYVTMCCDKRSSENEELTTKAQRFKVLVSRLVANAFVNGYSETQNVVKHLNGDRQDNHAHNLKWVSKSCGSISKTSRIVVASLVDDPVVRKEFLSRRKAENGLSIGLTSVRSGQSVKKTINWNGEKRLALVQVL